MITKERALEALDRIIKGTSLAGVPDVIQFIEETDDLRRQLAEAQAVADDAKADREIDAMLAASTGGNEATTAKQIMEGGSDA